MTSLPPPAPPPAPPAAPPAAPSSDPPPPDRAPSLSPPFLALAQTSSLLSRTRSRLEKQGLLVALLATVPAGDIEAAVGWLVGEPICGPLGVGPAQLWELSGTVAPDVASLTLHDVESELDNARGAIHGEKVARVAALFAKLTAPERALFAGALTGSLRQGSLGGVMLLAIAERAGRSEGEVRRVVMLRGSITGAASALLGPHPQAPPPSGIELFRPIAPMLASPAESIEEALQGLADAQVEWKIDGVRAQIHKKGSRVALYSRQGNDITDGCRPLLPTFAALSADAFVLDAEVVLVGPDGVARPFQDSFSAMASGGAGPRDGDRLRVYLFDCLHRDGTDLLDAPLAVRLDALRAVAPPELIMPAAPATALEDAACFYADALAAGNEGVVVKDRASPYRFGARGRAWQKVKEFTTVDLVILAAEWGSGRRKGLLSNLHLGARRDDGSLCMIGKTFKGLTDEMLRWQTARLQELATGHVGHIVHVKPELVVEVRFNDVQRSPRYPGGIALRFARVVRYREDKTPAEVERLASLVAQMPGGEGDVATSAKARKKKARLEAQKRQLSFFDD